MGTVAFETLGCKVNTYETEAVWNLFSQAGFNRVDFKEQADVYVINTCTVTNTGDPKSRKVIRRAIRRNPDAVIAVMGCYSQISPKEIQDIEGVDIIIGTHGRHLLLDYVLEYMAERKPITQIDNIMKVDEFEELGVENFAENTRAFLKIQEGCNNFCTFCIIPWARGLIRSRKPEDVLAQASKLVAQGYNEIVLTGIHTAGYGEDLENYQFADLLRDLETVQGLKRLRISSIEASQITDEVIEVMKNSKILAHHLHVPIQSGSDGVLKRMKRHYTTEEYYQVIKKLKSIFPDLAITTDVIVGFPGETNEEFQETYDFIEKVGFSELHIFPYSKRNGTPAARMDGQIHSLIKSSRVNELMALNEKLGVAFAHQFLGKNQTIIFENESDDQFLFGHTSQFMKVKVKAEKELINEMREVKIVEVGYPISIGELI